MLKDKIKALSKSQRLVLDQICMGNDSNHSKQSLKALIDKGLIAHHKQYLSPLFFVDRYDVATYGIHIAWCEVCSEEVGNDAITA